MEYPKWGVQPILGALNVHGILALAGVVGPVVLIVADLVAAFSGTTYDFIRDSISSLALTPMGWVQTIGFLSIGLLVEIFTAGLLLNIRRRFGFGLGVGLLACFGFGLLLIGAFQTDPVGGLRTIEGTIHEVTAAAILWLFPIAILLLLPSLRNDPYWQGMFPYTIVTSMFALTLAMGQLFLPAQFSCFGLYERVLVANAVIWVEVAAIRLLLLSLRRQREAKQTEDVSA
ncbi:DUF998 domain-containing protein [Chloroflexota bacterium]